MNKGHFDKLDVIKEFPLTKTKTKEHKTYEKTSHKMEELAIHTQISVKSFNLRML